MNFKQFFTEGGKILSKAGTELSRIKKEDFLTAKSTLKPLLDQMGLDSYWAAGGAGSFDPEHPYGGGGRDDSGDIDILVDPSQLVEKFPKDVNEYLSEIKAEAVNAGKKFSKPSGSPEEMQLKASKRELAKYMTENGYETTPGSLTLKYSANGKNYSVDLITRARSSWELHTHDFTKDPGMRGGDLWLNLYPLLAKLASSTTFVDPKSGEEKGNLQFSPDRGLVDRDTNKVVAGSKNEIAKILLGPDATAVDLASKTGIKNKLINQPEKWTAIKQFFQQQNESVSTNSSDLLIEGIEHLEDSILKGGIEGALKAFKEISSLAKSGRTISLKWDGFPALIFGWKELPNKQNPNGQFLFVDKHMYDKMVKGKINFTTIKDYDEARGSNRSSLWQAESLLVPVLKRATPQIENQFYFGDLMWAGMPSVEDGYYVFEPNTVRYKVKIDSETGRDISRSVGGIAVHTFIPSFGGEDQPLKGLKGLNPNEGITLLTGELLDEPVVTLPPSLVEATKKTIADYKGEVQKFLDYLTEIKAKGLLDKMTTFITAMLEQGDIANNIIPRFLEYLERKLTPAAAEKLLGTNKDGWLYKEGAPGLYGMWAIWASLTDLKLNIKKQIDLQQTGLPIQARVGEVDSHEGYVFGSGKNKLKLIDRLVFSKANFEKRKDSPQDLQTLDAKRQMPLAAFCFGRMNPPTIGHELLMQKTVEIGGRNTFIFLSSSNNKKTDPLDVDTKREFIKKIYPKFASYIVAQPVSTVLSAAKYLYNLGFRNMTFVAGDDRLTGKDEENMKGLLTSWNRADIRKADDREIVALNFESSGARDASAGLSSLAGISGTLARNFAKENNKEGFYQATGISDEITVNGKTLFQTTREAMGLPLVESFQSFFKSKL
jgi:Family of unknown function (DUF6267)